MFPNKGGKKTEWGIELIKERNFPKPREPNIPIFNYVFVFSQRIKTKCGGVHRRRGEKGLNTHQNSLGSSKFGQLIMYNSNFHIHYYIPITCTSVAFKHITI